MGVYIFGGFWGIILCYFRILSIGAGAIALGFVFYKLIGPVGRWYEGI